ncbi:MAG: hypothetical protein ACE5H4_06430 [Candidatus Thorarchaeota archaeon]
MTSEKEYLQSFEKKIDKIGEETTKIRKEVEGLIAATDLEKKVEGIEEVIKDVQSQVTPVSKIEDLLKSVQELNTTLAKLGETKTSESIGKKVDGLADSIKGIDSTVIEIRDSKEMEVLFKKMDDILVNVVDIGNEVKGAGSLDGVDKKIDDLQQYVAGVSAIEDNIQDLSNSLSETKEIVGIIVRQLDDLERKYNLSLEKMTEALEEAASMAQASAASEPAAKAAKKPAKKAPKEKEPADKVKMKPKKVTPSAIDDVMADLLEMVTPQTEAKEMAGALEEVRDQLTLMIKGHTPVLFQFGKKARELKSYPPTATLNENDIAVLNTEIRAWTSKLKEIAKGS